MEKGKEPEVAPKEEAHPTGGAEPPKTETSAPSPVKREVLDSDDDDDDNDELDDLLDEFAPLKVNENDAPSSSGPGRPTRAAAADVGPTETEDEFAAKLQEGMGELLKELDSDPELARQMEALVKGLQVQEADGVPGSSAPAEAALGLASGGGVGGEESFQDTIRKTMERMQNSGDSASAAVAGAADDDILAQLLKEMEGGAGGGGEGGDEDLTKMFLNMMEQLTNKEMLYEPMKELNRKFPDWIKENRGKVEGEKMKSYEEQAGIVREIVNKFEEPGYTDENPDHRAYIWERMQKMQAAGSPPEDLVANPLGGEGMPGIPQLGEDGVPGCPAQ